MEDSILLQEIGKIIAGVKSELKQDIQGMRQEMNDRIQSVDDRIQSVEHNLNETRQEMNDRFQSVDDRIQTVEIKLHETSVIVESLPEQIRLIAEQHTDIIENQKKILISLASYEETKSRVAALETVVRIHTKEITELKQAAV